MKTNKKLFKKQKVALNDRRALKKLWDSKVVYDFDEKE